MNSKAGLNQSDIIFLKECLDMAWRVQTLALPNPSVSAIITDKNGKLIGKGVHTIAGSPHAEILAIKEAFFTLIQNLNAQNPSIKGFEAKELEAFRYCHNSRDIHTFLKANHANMFKDCTLYVSLEPCNHQGKTPSCAALIEELGFARVLIGTLDSNPIAQGGRQRLLQAGIPTYCLHSYDASSTNPCTTLHTTSLNELSESSLDSERLSSLARQFEELLIPFEILRTKGRFVLFKLAQRLDGSYQNGRISCLDSELFTHNQRTICDYIIISGKTLLCDKPQLNTRFAKPPFVRLDSQMPKVGILSKRDCSEIEALITHNPHLHNRTTHLKSPSEIKSLQGFVIIEGGVPLLQACMEEIDMLLIHQSMCYHAPITHSPHTLNAKFSLLFSTALGEDLALWLR